MFIREKRRGFNVGVLFATMLLSIACALHAQILNGSFEEDPCTIPPPQWQPRDPNCENCTINNVISAPCTTCSAQLGQQAELLHIYTHTRSNITINPVDGQYFVMLRTGRYSQITQPIDVNEGQTIVGSYFFATTDWVPPWNDTSMIYLSSPDANQTTGLYDIKILLAIKDVTAVTSFGAMRDWERFSYTFDSNEAGSYMLVLRVEDAVDAAYTSYLAIDALKIFDLPPVPFCVYNPIGDLNHDCKVDFIDFAMMAENWLVDCSVTTGEPACLPPQP